MLHSDGKRKVQSGLDGMKMGREWLERGDADNPEVWHHSDLTCKPIVPVAGVDPNNYIWIPKVCLLLISFLPF